MSFKSVSQKIIALLFVALVFFSSVFRVSNLLVDPDYELWLMSFESELSFFQKVKVRMAYRLGADINYARELSGEYRVLKISTLDNAIKTKNNYILVVYGVRGLNDSYEIKK